LLWNITAGVGYPVFSGSTAVADHGKFALRFDDGYWYCWDLQTGKQLWKSVLTTWPWGTFGCYGVQSYGGNIIANQYDGIAAYNWDNGQISWFFNATAPYSFETPYQNYYPWFTGVSVIADGKLYAYNTEHTPSQPETRGWKIYCINVTTGQNIWNITGSMTPGAVADGYLTAANMDDGYMYVFGKGQSATTITTPNTAVTQGTPVVIKGTIMDMSPGNQGSFQNPTTQPDSNTKAGTVPCVSDASMETQMEYLYMQLPANGLSGNVTITGVPVTLTAIGSDGTVYNIGTTTTNGYYGTYTVAWTPPKVDTYTVTATFAGTNSYGSSSAATGLSINLQATSPTPQPAQAAPDYTMTIVAGVIAVIIAVAIVGALIMLMLKKRH